MSLTHSCSGRIPSPTHNGLQFLSVEQAQRIEFSLRAKGVIRERARPSRIAQVLEHRDSAVELFRDGYSEFCFQEDVLALGGFADGRPLLEAGSGNNDLGYFGSLRSFMEPLWSKNNYLLSNYSGGRGDYFAVQALCAVHNAEAQMVGASPDSYSVDNFCVTIGGQGALTAVASFLKYARPGQQMVLADSSFSSNFAPFRLRGVPLNFINSDNNDGLVSALPSVARVIEALNAPNVCAWMYVKYHNPSGEMYEANQLREVIRTLKKNNQYLVYPEAYEVLSHNAEEGRRSFLSVLRIASEEGYNKLIRLKTISKEFGFAGLRGGYLIAPPEVARYAQDLNAVALFNAPMVNSTVLVACSYLRYLFIGGARIPSIAQYLGSDLSDLHECHSIKDDFLLQNKTLFQHANFVSAAVRQGESGVSTVITPAGGINLYFKLDQFESGNPLDVFRRAYLLTGLIMHPGAFLGHKAGFWTRVTVSHGLDRLQDCVRAIRVLLDNKDWLTEVSKIPSSRLITTAIEPGV